MQVRWGGRWGGEKEREAERERGHRRATVGPQPVKSNEENRFVLPFTTQHRQRLSGTHGPSR